MSREDDTEILPMPSAEPGHTAGYDGDLAAALSAAAPRRWHNRTTLVLAALLFLVGGLLGGVEVQKRWGATATGANNNRPGLPAGTGTGRFPDAAGPATGADQGGATPSAAAAGATGTVKLVDGATVYVQTADGSIVTVRTNAETTVRASQRSALTDLKAGDAVTVQGAADAEGTVTATTVTSDRK